MSASCEPCAPATDCVLEDDFAYSITSGPTYSVVPPPANPPCSGCAAPVDCNSGLNNQDNLDYTYTITGDPTLPFIFYCPPGANCISNVPKDVYMSCCGHLLAETAPANATPTQLSAIVSDLMGQCQQYASECANPPTGGGPSGPGPTPPIPGPGHSPTGIYFNEAQTCNSACPDGTTQPYTIPAGTSIGRSPAAANATALLLCNSQSGGNSICFGTLPSKACLGVIYDEILSLTLGPNVAKPLTYSGSPPDGIVLSNAEPAFSNSASLYGAPTSAGDSTFTITVTDANGLTASKQFTISVLGIITTSIPSGTVGSPYSSQLTAQGGTPPYKFAAAGSPYALPDGLNVTPSGLINGTPTTTGTFTNVGVTVTDSTGAQCLKVFSVTIGTPVNGNDPFSTECPDNHSIVAGTAGNTYTSGGGPSDPDKYSLNSTASVAAFNKLTGLGCNICDAQVTAVPRININTSSPNLHGNIWTSSCGVWVTAQPNYPPYAPPSGSQDFFLNGTVDLFSAFIYPPGAFGYAPGTIIRVYQYQTSPANLLFTLYF